MNTTLTTLLPKSAIILTNQGAPELDALLPVARNYAEAALALGGAIAIIPKMTNIVFARTDKNKGGWALIYSAHISGNGAAGTNLANFKQKCNELLSDVGIPAPVGSTITKAAWKGKSAAHVLPPFPVVAKPNADTVKGIGVVTNIRDAKSLDKILTKLFQEYKKIIIEEYITAKNEYRVLVLDGKIIGIVQRIPAYVVGDGKQTIRQLITEKNVLRKKAEAGTIKLDADLYQTLSAEGITLQMIPKKDQTVSVKKVCNFGSGGETKIMDVKVHAEIKKIMKDIAAFTGLRLIGVDVKANSLTDPLEKSKAKIIELNPNPDIAMHGAVDPRMSINIAKKVLRAITQD